MIQGLLKSVMLSLHRPRMVFALAVLVALPTLWSGFFIDDYLHLLTLRGDGFGATPFDLFNFADGDPALLSEQIASGPLPWYSWPALKVHFFRPLSSASMLLDYHLFGTRSFFYHVHSVAWYALLVWGAFLLFRRSFAAPIAGLCVLLFALDGGHLVPVQWWSNRNAIISAAPALLGLVAHLRWREDGWKPGLALSLLGYSIGLLGGETALGIFGYLAAWELFRPEPLFTRVKSLAPAALLGVLYLMTYKALGYGVQGSGIYFDPMGEWPLYLASAPGRLLDLAGTQFFLLPVELSVVTPGITMPMRVVAFFLLVLLVAALRQLWSCLRTHERRQFTWLGFGAMLSVAPALATFPSGRLLLLPSVGACAVIALLIYHGLGGAASAMPTLGRRTARALAVLHLALMPFVWIGGGLAVPILINLSEDAFRTVEVDAAKIGEQRVFCLFAADPYTGFYPVVMRRYFGLPEPRGWMTLSMAPFDHEVTRTAVNRFELRVLEGEMLSTPFERLMRSHAYPMKPGDVVACEGFRLEVLECGRWGPRRIALEFERPLDDPAYHFLAWQRGNLTAFTWPAVGESLRLRVSDGYFAWQHFKKRLPLV